MRPLRRVTAVVLAGDARVWRVAAIAAIPLVALIAYYCLRPRDYYTGTNSVEAYTYIAEARAGEPVCVPGLEIPAGTARIRLQLISRTPARPALRMALHLGASTEPSAADEHGEGGAGNGARPLRQSVSVPGTATIESALAPVTVPSNRVSAAVFTLPGLSAETSERPASLCLTAGGLVNWGGTPLLAPPSSDAPTLGGSPVAGRIAVWYEPPAGSQRSYFARAGSILKRASLFRPSPVGPWLYVLILLIILPGLALAAVRCLAVAVAAGGGAAARAARRRGCSRSPR